MALRLKALGTLTVEGPGGPLTGPAAHRRTLALIVLLAAARERGVNREKLIGVLWPDTTDGRARHALAQTLYRLRQEFGADAVEGTETLRLNPSAFAVDVTEYEDAVASGELPAAAALYGGPFLEGFTLPGVPELERWVEQERARLGWMQRDVLERLADEATRAGEHGRAAQWWRALAVLDRLDSRVAARLVDAMVAAGDRNGALQYARVHATLVREELGEEPGAEFTAAVERARTRTDSAPQGVRVPAPTPAPTPSPPPSEAEVALQDRGSSAGAATAGLPSEHVRVSRTSWRRVAWRAAAAVAAAAVAVGVVAQANGGRPVERRTPLVAVGHIADYTGDDSTGAARLLPEMLTTSISRLDGLALLGRSRLLAYLPPDTGRASQGSDFARAAQRAGVQQLVDGALYRRPDGALRLDLRVLDVRTGRVRQVHELQAVDKFALADSATVRLASGFGVPVPQTLRASEVTTASLAAFRLYDEGWKAYNRFEFAAAKQFFDAALGADSGFAMAAFGAYHATHDPRYLERALRLAKGATERERLLIRAELADMGNEPAHLVIAESLAVRYPSDPQSHLSLASALFWRGDFAAARAAARQAAAMDSVDRPARARPCTACQASGMIHGTYLYQDSIEASERFARQWVAREPRSPGAWLALLRSLELQNDSLGALEIYGRSRMLTFPPGDDWPWVAGLAIRTGDFEKAERVLRGILESGTPGARAEALWWLAISYRHQGRTAEAYASAKGAEALDTSGDPSLLVGQTLFEMGRYREAARHFDRRARVYSVRPGAPSGRARHVTWALTHKATSLAAAGDLPAVEALADSLRTLGARSGYGRDPRLHHHARGLVLAARARKEEALREFRLAMFSPSAGYTRTNLEMGRLLIELGRAEEAIPVLRAALHGALESVNLYVTHTEIRALLSRAFEAAGHRDSAATHARWVARALAAADPRGRERVEALLGRPIAPAVAGAAMR